MARAAVRLGVAQPAVSQHIKRLEQRLDAQLFERSSKGLRLTGLGSALLPEARAAVELADWAVELAEKAGQGAVGTIKLGFVDSAMFGARFRDLLETFRSLYPAVNLVLQPSTVAKQIASIGDGSIDFGFVRAPLPPLSDPVAAELFDRDALSIAVSNAHRLADKHRVAMADIAEEALILSQDPEGIGLSGHVCHAFRQMGVTPRIVQRVEETASMSALVAAGIGVAVLPGTLASLRLPNVRFVPLSIAPSELILIYRANEQRPAPLAFLKCCRKAMGGAERQASLPQGAKDGVSGR